MSCYIGIDIGGTNIRIGHGGIDAGLLGYERYPQNSVLIDSNVSANIAYLIRQYMKQYNLKKVNAIGIGLPSTLSLDRRTILQTPNIPDMNQLPIADELEELLHTPVYPEKDTNMLFLHDSLNLVSEGIAIGIYIGTGIGNALFINGHPYIGKHGVAGEIGHIPVPGNTNVCGCGNKGCAECIASGTYLRRIQEERFPETDIGNLFHFHGNDPALINFVDNIASVVATEINILDPEYVIIGGGIPEMKGFPKDLFVNQIHKHCRKPYPDQGLNLIFSKSSQTSGVLGAIILATNMNINNINHR